MSLCTSHVHPVSPKCVALHVKQRVIKRARWCIVDVQPKLAEAIAKLRIQPFATCSPTSALPIKNALVPRRIQAIDLCNRLSALMRQEIRHPRALSSISCGSKATAQVDLKAIRYRHHIAPDLCTPPPHLTIESLAVD